MPSRISHEDLMRFLDGELPPEEHDRVAQAVAGDTELKREVAIYRAMKGDFQDLSFHPGNLHRSVWDEVDDKLTRPVGWLLFIGGTVVWMLYSIYVFATGPADPWEKMATGAVVIGVILLLTSVIFEQYRAYLQDPYRDVHR